MASSSTVQSNISNLRMDSQQQQPLMRSLTPNLSRNIRTQQTISRSHSSLHPSLHPANTSSSKQMFSFGVGDRFKKPKVVLNQSIGYNLKSTLFSRDVSFGKGPRTPNMVRKNFDKFPEPGQYKLPSDFEKPQNSYNAGKQFTFGAPRCAYDRVYFKERIPHDRSIPGPGHYNQNGNTIQMNRNKSFTMLSRIPQESHIAVKVHNPGPGTYKEQDEMTKEGRYVKSTHKNSCVPEFKRSVHKKSEERVVAINYSKDNPGPGTYTPQDTDRTNKYRNGYNMTLYQGERKIELHDKTKMTLPGPQQYTLPSDFGHPPSQNSTASFNIPRQIRRKRSRNNAAYGLSMTKSTTMFNATLTENQRTQNHNLASPRGVTDGLIEQESTAQTEHKQTVKDKSGFRKFIVSQSTNDLKNTTMQGQSATKLQIKKLTRPQKPNAQNTDSAAKRADLMKQIATIKQKQHAMLILNSPESEKQEKVARTPLEESQIGSAEAHNRPKSGAHNVTGQINQKEGGHNKVLSTKTGNNSLSTATQMHQ